ncbi:MAG: anthranilate phosphoribosyltransferase, partial [Mariprofundaceae bacterium]|nr:anthranilate phosphoribosyltransferase [Mariprofundaceae bacterium]
AGVPVVLHGMQHIEGRLSAWQALQAAGVRRAVSVQSASVVLKSEGIVYMDVAEICPPLFALLKLRPRLGVRSFAHTVARLLNPLGCAGQLNGVFHTPYVSLMAQANARLDQPRSLIFMGAEGEAELYASRQKLMTAQMHHETVALSYADAACDLYPRQIERDAAFLLDGFTGLCSGQMDGREAVVLERMQQAFAFASTGVIPQDWTDTVQGEQDIKGETI